MPAKRTNQAQTDGYAIRRAEIVDVAAHLFAQHGYSATGIAQIGDAVHLARGALYYYIDSKETLLTEIHDRVMDPLLATTKEIVHLDATAPVRLRLVSEELLTQILDRHDHVWVFLHEYRTLSGERFSYFHKRRRQFEDYICALLEEGCADGALQIQDVRLATLSFLNLHNYTYQWVQAEGRLDARELSAFYCRIFFDGVGSTVSSAEIDAEVAKMERSSPGP